MNIDDLSKSQLLLLTLLVNFVMSIATGIVTVSLLNQAPATVTQTVNRIVEHTVETVTQQPATTDTTPKTVAEKPTEEDMLVSAIAGDVARTVRLYAQSTTTPPLAQGIYLSKSRAVVVATDEALPENAVVEFPDKTIAQVSVSKADKTMVIYGFSDTAELPVAPVTVLLSPESLKQGQAVIGLLADGSAVTGIISKVNGEVVTTTLPVTPKGASAVTLRGELVGMSLGNGSYVSSQHINDLLATKTN